MLAPQPIPVTTAQDGFRFVAVGEAGRGRQQARVPVARELLGDTISRASVAPTARGGVILLPERDPADDRALVLLNDQSGYRGGWTLLCGVLAPPSEDFPLPGTGFPDPEGRQAARQEMIKRDHPTPRHHEGPPVWYPAGAGKVAVVAEGYCAQGGAGRMGGGPEYLLALTPGAALTIHRTGRLYGSAARIILTWDGVVLAKTPWEDYAARLAAQEVPTTQW